MPFHDSYIIFVLLVNYFNLNTVAIPTLITPYHMCHVKHVELTHDDILTFEGKKTAIHYCITRKGHVTS